jgi:hypothetical protein
MYYLSTASAKLARFFYFGNAAKNLSPAGLVYLVYPFAIWMLMSAVNILLILMFDVESLRYYFAGVTLSGVSILFLIKMIYFRDLKINQDKRLRENDEIRKEKWEEVFQVD